MTKELTINLGFYQYPVLEIYLALKVNIPANSKFLNIINLTISCANTPVIGDAKIESLGSGTLTNLFSESTTINMVSINHNLSHPLWVIQKMNSTN